MSTIMKVLGGIFVLIAVYLVVTSGGNFNSIINRIALNIGRLTNQLQGISSNTTNP